MCVSINAAHLIAKTFPFCPTYFPRPVYNTIFTMFAGIVLYCTVLFLILIQIIAIFVGVYVQTVVTLRGFILHGTTGVKLMLIKFRFEVIGIIK